MNCRPTRELLPWLVNETLDPSQERQVTEHLELCASCRAELEETRIALAVAAQHLPIAALVAHAAGRDPGVEPELLETHLASCRACAGELELLIESRDALADETPAREAKLLAWRLPAASPSSAGWWRGAAAAAALAALVGGVAAVRGARQVSRLGERIARLEMPMPNVTVVDLYHDLVVRAEESVASVPASSTPSTLILNSELPATAGPFRLEIRDANGQKVVEIQNLTPDADGLLTLSLVTKSLPAGKLVLSLKSSEEERSEVLESYRFEVR